MDVFLGKEYYSIDIDGTPVVFPFKPYDCQITYIRGVITALTESKNALLESPTGTGKTLCLLCASLAWQQKNTSSMASQSSPPPVTELAYEKTTVTDLSRPRQQHRHNQASAAAPALPSVIIYASRTHSQLSQVATELKNTIYRPRLSLLGSRDQLCVHEEVSQMKGPAKNHACLALVSARRCKYHRGTESMEQAGGVPGGVATMNSTGGARGLSEQNTISDIEELVSLAKQHEFCPYYLGRAQAPRAELVLMPYNYLLDPGTRRGIKLNWSNSVVIFDEAHNLESVASEAASFELTSAQVAGAQEEALRCHKILTEGGGGVDEEVGSAAQADDALALKQALHLLEDAMEGVELPSSGSSSSRGVTRAGEFVYALFEHAGITFGTVSLWLGKLQEMSDTLQENALYGQANALKLDSVARAIKVAFRGGNASREECLSFSQMYRAHVAPVETVISPMDASGRRGRGGIGIGGRKVAGGGGGSGRVLCFWCFCPGVAMEDLRALGVRSIIITSGTLSPLSSFANELRLPFEVQVENPHVIGPEQAWIGTLGKGVMNVTLNSSYANRDNDHYKDELGATLANLCRIVPGGMLVFFSTYRTMDDCIQRWKHYDNGKTWSRIAAHKGLMVEPRSAADLKAVMEEYDARIDNTGGAVFLAVCRGKVSEGMDFSDGRARCVVVTGIPYAPAMDAKVILKKKYMSESPLPPGVARVTGQEWYQQQASRAVNQAIGRVIRHRRDFGCVVLCDARFAEERNRQSLSLWARPFVRECNGFGKVAADLTRFFKACAANPNLKHINTTTSGPPQPKLSHPRLTGTTRATVPSHGASRHLKGSVLDSTEWKLAVAGSGEGRGTVDMTSLQDVGDIVQSVGRRERGRADSESSGGSRRGGSHIGGADSASTVSSGGPLGLFQALKASAHLVDGRAAKTTPGPSEGDRRDLACSRNSSDEKGGSGWESVPLSQRLAKVGTKSASSGPRLSSRQPPSRANPDKYQSGRVSGLRGGRSLSGGSIAAGGAKHRNDDVPGLHSNDGNGGSDSGSGSGRLKESSTHHRDGKGFDDTAEKHSPTAEFTPRSRSSSVSGGGSRTHQRSDTALDTTETVTTSIAPHKKSTMLSRGVDGGMERSQKVEDTSSGSGGGRGHTRRQELEAFLSDLKKNVSRGAYDVFRSRAKAMKEGALEATETALPALKGVLEVLLLAPSELKLPGRFSDHIPEEHKDLYRVLVAKRRPETGDRNVSKTAEEGVIKIRDGHNFDRGSGSLDKEHLFDGDGSRAGRKSLGKKGGRVLELGRPGSASDNYSSRNRNPGDRKLVDAKSSDRSLSQSSSRGTMTGGAEATTGPVGIGASSKRARLMAGGRDDSIKIVGRGDGHSRANRRTVAVGAPSSGDRRGGAEGRYKSQEGGASQNRHQNPASR